MLPGEIIARKYLRCPRLGREENGPSGTTSGHGKRETGEAGAVPIIRGEDNGDPAFNVWPHRCEVIHVRRALRASALNSSARGVSLDLATLPHVDYHDHAVP